MSALDTFVFSKYILEAHPGKLKLYQPKVFMCSLSDVDGFIFINSESIKDWFKSLRTCLYNAQIELVSKNTSAVVQEKSKNLSCKSEELISDVYSENEYIIRIVDNLHVIEKKGFKPCIFKFNSVELSDLIVGISHMYISTLCLPSVIQLAFVLLMNYFESYAIVEDFKKTVEHIRNDCNAEFYIKHFDAICEDHDLPVSGISIYSSLQKFEKYFVTLFKMRICKQLIIKKVAV